MRTSATSAFLLVTLAACSCGTSTSNGLGTNESHEIRPFTGWSEPGVALFVECQSVPDHSTCSVYGEEHGETIAGSTLLTRAASRPELLPDELARRSEALLFGEAGAEPVLPGGGPRMFVSPEEETIITAPARNGAELVYFRMEGEMHPTLMRVRVDLATGNILARETGTAVYAESAPALETVCEAWSVCGCEMGCASFEHIHTPDGERYRSADGRMFFRMNEGFPLRFVADETCTEACPPGPARTRCGLIDGVCQPVPEAASAPVGTEAPAPAASS